MYRVYARGRQAERVRRLNGSYDSIFAVAQPWGEGVKFRVIGDDGDNFTTEICCIMPAKAPLQANKLSR